ncbi:MAG: single-stranded-DNA-specific exonuclease RecJ, partial [Candidatus Eisenbacteria bacterium]
AGRVPVSRLPNRLTEGYDLSTTAVEDLAAAGVTLLITVDCGITAVEAVRRGTQRGIDCIITDHHEPKGTLPEAVALIDPRRPECGYPYKDLAGVGIAWKLADALAASGIGSREEILEDLDLVAVGTIADVSQLTGENRIFVREGLERLASTAKPGLRALLEVAGFAERRLDYASVAFGIGPRINAAGRLGEAEPALELLTTDSRTRSRELAFLLDRMNRERRALDERILEEALARVEEEDPGGIVLASEQWHPGVIGIVASRIKEKTGAPVVLIAVDGTVGRGSARSVPGFPLHEALEECSDLLLRHGGHALAAGLTIEADRIDPFRERFREIFERRRGELDPPGSLLVDAEAEIERCDGELLGALAKLEPFGPGNRRPILMACGLSVRGGFREVGKDHLSFSAGRGNVWLDAIAFRVGHEKAWEWSGHGRIDLAFSLEENRWGGESRLRMNVKGLRRGTEGR